MDPATAAATIRTDGPGAWLVPSASEPGVMHRVTLAPESCDCKGFFYRSRCRHLEEVIRWYQTHALNADPDEEPDDEDDEDDPENDSAPTGEEVLCEVYSAGQIVQETRPGAPNTRPGQVKGCRRRQATALDDRAKESLMSTLRIPSLPQIDEAQRMLDLRYATLQRVVKAHIEEIAEAWIDRLQADSNDPQSPIAVPFDDLESGPMEDQFDLSGWIKYAPTRDKVQLGEAVMWAAGEAQLAVVEKWLDVALGGGAAMATRTKTKKRQPRVYTQARCVKGCATFLLGGTKGQLIAKGTWRRGCSYCKGRLVKTGEVRE
jgi:hypothetical protein